MFYIIFWFSNLVVGFFVARINLYYHETTNDNDIPRGYERVDRQSERERGICREGEDKYGCMELRNK